MLTHQFTKISSLPLEYTDNNYENTGDKEKVTWSSSSQVVFNSILHEMSHLIYYSYSPY